MASFSLTYQDYVNTHPGDATGGSEGGSGTSSLISEADWNKMSDADKWKEVGNGVILTPGDPRYDELANQLGVTDGRQIVGGPTKESVPLNTTYFVDPNRVVKDGDLFFTSDENLTPKAQEQGGVADWYWPVMFAAGVAGGMVAQGAGLGGTAVTSGEASLGGGFTGYGDIAASGTAGGAGVGASLAPPPSGEPPPGSTYDPYGNGETLSGNPPGSPPATGTEPPPGSTYDPYGSGETLGNNLTNGQAEVVEHSIPAGSQVPAEVVEHSVNQPWYQTWIDKIAAPGAAGRLLSALPAATTALKPLAAGPPPSPYSNFGSTLINSGRGGTGSLQQRPVPFQAITNPALQSSPQRPGSEIKSLGDFLRGA